MLPGTMVNLWSLDMESEKGAERTDANASEVKLQMEIVRGGCRRAGGVLSGLIDSIINYNGSILSCI